MLFGFFKRRVIDAISSESELRELLSIVKSDKKEIEKEIEEKNKQIEQIEKMLETFQ